MGNGNHPTKGDVEARGLDSTQATETSMSKEHQGAAVDSPERRKKSFISRTWSHRLILLLFVIGAIGVFWWQHQYFSAVVAEFENEANLAHTESLALLEQASSDLQTLESRLNSLRAASELNQRLTEENINRTETLPNRLLSVEERLGAMQGVSEDARRRWLKAEAEYYLTVANGELQLAGDWENAVMALVLADEKLQELANPALGVVRQRIQSEIQALRAVAQPDAEGLILNLGALALRVNELPIRSRLSASNPTGQALGPATELGLPRFWQTLKDGLSGMIRIERLGEPAGEILTLEQSDLARQRALVALNTAQLALLREQPEVFRQSLATVSNILGQDFESADPSVISALGLIEEMLSIDIAPLRPDISGSLDLLRNIQSGAG